ncbi:hypothetical protein [Streptomyces glaucus]|uniref:Uncharacterized protein n=1 Tax=Streptomyces glaucus TaxID=284029 RepID=A0ABN3JW45_9ACTN
MSSATTLPDLDTLDDHELANLHSEAGRILRERIEAELPTTIRDSIRETLDEDDDTRTPVRAVFTTTKWDNGYFWDESGAEVTFSDGSTDTLDLDDTEADEALIEHQSYLVDPLNSSDTLTVTFDPPSLHVG